MGRCSHAALLLAIALTSLAQTGYALKCWSCMSDVDPDCGDPFYSKGKKLTECKAQHEGERPTCEALVIKVNSLERTIMRSCGSVPMDGPLNVSCYVKLPTHSKIERCDVCIQDGCNAATVQRITYWVAAVSVLIMFLNDSLRCHF